MKKAVTILLSVLYLLGIMQISVAFHHCGGKLKYVKVQNIQKDRVCCKSGGHCCCTDKEVKYKVDDQQHSKTFIAKSKSFNDLNTGLPITQQFGLTVYPVIEVYKVSHSPPLVVGNIPRHILHCSYLI
ncbi:MAG: hypothetical protein H6551_11915 [Chitinophagales bacterium]|nr:hypothetical protein [Chitinophagaceae bacterium]MCB9065835.1 hypothetical protein [Chitinophagales bacterium]